MSEEPAFVRGNEQIDRLATDGIVTGVNEDAIRADERARVLRNLQLWVRFDIEYDQEHNDDSEFWQRRALANQGALDLVGRLADTFMNEFASMRSYEANVPKWTCQPIVRNAWRLPRWP